MVTGTTSIQEILDRNLQLKEWSELTGLPIPDEYKLELCDKQYRPVVDLNPNGSTNEAWVF